MIKGEKKEDFTASLHKLNKIFTAVDQYQLMTRNFWTEQVSQDIAAIKITCFKCKIEEPVLLHLL